MTPVKAAPCQHPGSDDVARQGCSLPAPEERCRLPLGRPAARTRIDADARQGCSLPAPGGALSTPVRAAR